MGGEWLKQARELAELRLHQRLGEQQLGMGCAARARAVPAEGSVRAREATALAMLPRFHCSTGAVLFQPNCTAGLRGTEAAVGTRPSLLQAAEWPSL